MECVFLLLLLVSGSLCSGNYSHLGTGTSLAVCQPDTCSLLSEVAAMRERLAVMTQPQSTLEQNVSAMMQKMAIVEANSQSYKSYTMYINNSGKTNSVGSLMMNSQRVVPTWDTVSDDSHNSTTNAAMVQREDGDSVFVMLYANRVLCGGDYYYLQRFLALHLAMKGVI